MEEKSEAEEQKFSREIFNQAAEVKAAMAAEGEPMKHTRVVMVEISGDNKFLVDRVANLLEEDCRTTSVFALGAIEIFSAAESSADDPARELPTVSVTNTLMGSPS